MIGIIGGVGPLAGLDLNRKIIENTVARNDQQHLAVLLASFSHAIADRTAYLASLKTNHASAMENPGIALGRVGHRLIKAGATVLGIPCNTAHSAAIWNAFTHYLQQQNIATRYTVAHMIEETFAEIVKKQCKKIGLMATLGTYGAQTYHLQAEKRKISVLEPSEEDKKLLQAAIYHPLWGVKGTPKASKKAKETMKTIAAKLADLGSECIIMGCTEIPLALTPRDVALPTIDPTLMLARALVNAENPHKLLAAN